MAHGNGGNMSHRLDKVRLLHDLGWWVLLFDYRGYGASDGEPSEEGTFADMAAAVDDVMSVRGVADDRLVLDGESLGGAVAVEAAVKEGSGGSGCGFFLHGASPPWRGTITPGSRRAPPPLPLRLPLAQCPLCKCPVFVLHSPEDDIVPYAMGRQLFAASPGPNASRTWWEATTRAG